MDRVHYKKESHSPKRRWTSRASNSEEDPRAPNKHPKGLKGKAIGLWYAKRNQLRKQEQGESGERAPKKNQRPLGKILLSDKKKRYITKVLNEAESSFPSLFRQKSSSYEHLEETEFKREFLVHIRGNIIEKLQSKIKCSVQYKNEGEDKIFLDELQEKEKEEEYLNMKTVRDKLPSMKMRHELLELIQNHQVVVISGETGCGKTTQVTQFILDDYIKRGKGSECKIICTQPRRISAISVAERVARERADHLGNSVGYQIRLEKVMPRNRGSILYCTTGVLLQYMGSDPSLGQASHLILDEIHERDILSDFLITLLREVVKYREDLKVILMSATLNSEAFSKYYNNAPHLNIPGFTYPVEEYFLEDVLQLTRHKFAIGTPKKRIDAEQCKEWSDFIIPYVRQLESEKKYDRTVTTELTKMESESLDLLLVFKLISELCQKNDDYGAILVFVPGFAEIQKLCFMLKDSVRFPFNKYIVIPLHSQLASVDQKQIFNPAPRGVRKIIISTNIAETSITIDDVTTVIDCGYIKITTLDPQSGIETLKSEWVSQANAAQRKGRAGRVKPGVCYHLISKVRYEILDKFLKPEVLRKRLEDVILQLKMLQLGEAEPFLSKLMDAPEAKSVHMSLELLQRLGALDESEILTPLGYHMAKLPVGAQCSKLLIMAALFSCIDPILSIAASLGFKEAYQLNTSDMKQADAKKFELSDCTNSDHLTMHYALQGFERASNPKAFCREFCLNSSTLRMLLDMRKQFAQDLYNMKFISSPNPCSSKNNYNSDNIDLVKAIISAGLYPNVAIVRQLNKKVTKLKSLSNETMELHPKSVLNHMPMVSTPLLVYHLRQVSSKIYVHDGTLVYPLPIVFFGDQFRIHEQTPEDSFQGISISDCLRFNCTQSTALIIQRLRNSLNDILEYKISHPGSIKWTTGNKETKVLRVISAMIVKECNNDADLSDYEDS